jgi:hypothetical protein
MSSSFATPFSKSGAICSCMRAPAAWGKSLPAAGRSLWTENDLLPAICEMGAAIRQSRAGGRVTHRNDR